MRKESEVKWRRSKNVFFNKNGDEKERERINKCIIKRSEMKWKWWNGKRVYTQTLITQHTNKLKTLPDNNASQCTICTRTFNLRKIQKQQKQEKNRARTFFEVIHECCGGREKNHYKNVLDGTILIRFCVFLLLSVV